MAGSRNWYTQLAIGVCGHVVGTWPQICDLGGANPEVVCEECMRQKYELDGEQLVIWVRLKPSETVGIPQAKKPKREAKPKKLNAWETLLRQEGLF